MDKLHKMFELQEDFQEILLNGEKIFRGTDVDFDFVREQSINLIDELMEAYREVPPRDKPWKKDQQFNHEKMKEELIDCWHYLINLSMAAGMDADEVFDIFLKKHLKNRTRTQ